MKLNIMVGNQRGGVGKTTTAVTVSRCLADKGMRVLLVDSDPQGSIEVLLALNPEKHQYLSHFILERLRLDDCLITAAPNLEVLCGNRETATMEQRIVGEYGREHIFEKAFGPYESRFDAMVFDVSPSITLSQACSMVFCRNIIIPISMDTLSVAAAGATISAAAAIGESISVPIRPVALLPTNVDKRYGLTDVVMKLIETLGKRYGIPVLDPIRTDSIVGKAGRAHKMIADLDRKAKALSDYETATASLLEILGQPVEQVDGPVPASATA